MSIQTATKSDIRAEIDKIIDQLPIEIFPHVLHLLEGLLNIFSRTSTNGNQENLSSLIPDSSQAEIAKDDDEEHPWMKFAGMFSESPYWDEYLECLAEARAELNTIEEYDDEPVPA